MSLVVSQSIGSGSSDSIGFSRMQVFLAQVSLFWQPEDMGGVFGA